MKPFLEVEENRKKYHLHPNKNTVHRSSLMAPNIEGSDVHISFLNHFLLKRGYDSIALKITAIGAEGNQLDSVTIEVKDPVVHSFNLSDMFSDTQPANFLVEFFSDKNLFIPFPAVMVNHVGKDFCNVVHSYNRVLNDIFENDSVNKTQVAEASIDVLCDQNYDTFVSFATGIVPVNDSLNLSYDDKDKSLTETIPVQMPRLSNKSFRLSEIIPDFKNRKGGLMKVNQPPQAMFYGRMLAGIVNKKTKAFTANHSYYDSSKVEEYFPNAESYRTYPYFEGFLNKIVMYPIMSPGEIKIQIRIVGKNKTFTSKDYVFTSPSHNPLDININDLVKGEGIEGATAFTVLATGASGKIPTRVNHQLIYGEPNGVSELNGSINVSLLNKSVFTPEYKKGYTWGQFLIGSGYESRLSLCFGATDGPDNVVKIDFYTTDGLTASKEITITPGQSAIFDIADIVKSGDTPEFGWFIAKCDRPDLAAYSFHYHKQSGNASGEHSF